MQLGEVRRPNGRVGVVLVESGHVFDLDMTRKPGVSTLADILHSADPVRLARELIDVGSTSEPAGRQTYLAPVDRQEVWAAGVTYKRSKVAREEESKGAAQFYDKVYTAPRPELFLKATPARVVHPGEPVKVRADSSWSVPEPELTLVVSPDLRIVGYTVGNDMSARDIEGENPLYLPQAKIYKQSCSVGPLVTLAAKMPPLADVEIKLTIKRGGATAFEGSTKLDQLSRTPESLVEWLGKENAFPDGVLLLTGTGIVPPDEFTLKPGDAVSIAITGVGTLSNPVV
jgi:2-dehydro-3-deoxy-D-arabinonate dehydratase